jgi:peptidoglycan/xylan/chitin deacetylase (PgdA/CDA1 family)
MSLLATAVILVAGAAIALLFSIGTLYTLAVRWLLRHGWLSSHVVYCAPPRSDGQKLVALTFDDAPYNGVENMNAITAYLRSQRCGATFFCLGDRLAKAPIGSVHSLCPAIELANHGYTNHSAVRAGAKAIEEEIKQTDALLLAREMHAPYYRPGSGLYNEPIVEAAVRQGLRVVLGDVYPFDPHIPIPWLVARSVCSNVRPGSIVIMHDRSWTMSALKTIVPRLLRDGYKIVSVSALLATQ